MALNELADYIYKHSKCFVPYEALVCILELINEHQDNGQQELRRYGLSMDANKRTHTNGSEVAVTPLERDCKA